MSFETGNGEMQKVFEYFSEMPNELKLMMTKEMEVCDRYRFAKCSKSSRDFWEKITRNQHCSSTVFVLEHIIQFEVHHGGYDTFGRAKDGFRLAFENNESDGRKSIRYSKLPYKELWSYKVDKSIDIVQTGIDYVEKKLEFYQNGIKELDIIGSCTEGMLVNLENSIGSFKNLEVLYVYDCAEVLYLVLSKLRNPLKKLRADLSDNQTNHKNCDQLFRVQDELRSFQLNFDYPEFIRLSAKHVYINIGKLTEQDIFNFMKSWENGTYKGRIEKCAWDLRRFKFKKRRLCQLFEIDYSESSINVINLVQKSSGKNATLKVYNRDLEFITSSQ